jgi:hypothetical protein
MMKQYPNFVLQHCLQDAVKMLNEAIVRIGHLPVKVVRAMT